VSDLEQRIRRYVETLPEGVRDHCFRVEEISDRLATIHHVDRERSRLAGLAHDIVRHKTDAELLLLAGEYGIHPDDIQRLSPVLLHGPVAARILVRDFAMTDADIINGIDCHTTARAGMAPVEQVMFIADKIDPHKVERNPELEQVRDLAQADLAAAVLRYLDIVIAEALREPYPIHPLTTEARNALILARLAAETH
jgi:predicted HD superfamily hydrolase involved in NAD metabolism